MQRLLKDAEALTGKKYDLNNLGDVYEAIHVIQGELGLTGVAAAEAEGTFTGSFASMRAAAQNFLGELAIGEDVSESLNVLLVSASTFIFNNLLPMIGTVIKSLPGAIIAFIRQGVPILLNNISQLVSNLTNSVGSLSRSLTGEKIQEWLATALPQMLSAGGRLIGHFAQALITNIPKIAAALVKIGFTIITGLGSALWGKVTAAANGIKDRFLAPINTLKDKVKGIIDKIKGFFSFKISAPHVPLPHFSISPAGWKIGDLLKGTKPSLSVQWYAKGGIVEDPTIFSGIGMGEAGHEAIVPLTPFWDRMDKLANSLQRGGDVTINVYATPSMDVKQLASEVQKQLIETQNRRRLAWQ